jgi:hypothetical protein
MKIDNMINNMIGKQKVHLTQKINVPRSGAPVAMQIQWKAFNDKQKNMFRKVYKDSDKDGVPNRWDCQPFNKRRQENLWATRYGNQKDGFIDKITNEEGKIVKEHKWAKGEKPKFSPSLNNQKISGRDIGWRDDDEAIEQGFGPQKTFHFSDIDEDITEQQIKDTTFEGDKLINVVEDLDIGDETVINNPEGSRAESFRVKRVK